MGFGYKSQMVKKIKKFYRCETCELLYKNKSWAEKCEDWCKKNKSCSLEITKHSIKKTLEDLKEENKIEKDLKDISILNLNERR